MKGLDILEYEGSGYKRLVNNGKWTFAGLNWAPRFDENNLADLERHNLTDEGKGMFLLHSSLWSASA